MINHNQSHQQQQQQEFIQTNLQNGNNNSNHETWTILTKFLNSWTNINEKGGETLFLYSIGFLNQLNNTSNTNIASQNNPSLLYFLSNVNFFNSGKYSEIIHPLSVNNNTNTNNSNQITIIIKPHRIQHFSYRELRSLQSSFGNLLSYFLGTKYQQYLSNQSIFLSPIILVCSDIFDWNNETNSYNLHDENLRYHPFYSYLPYLINELENIINLQCFELTTGIQFKSLSNLNTALTAPSSQSSLSNYDRFEIFGDSILKFMISFYLYNQYQSLPEGDLSRLKDEFISNLALCRIGKNIEISNFLKVKSFSLKNYLPFGYNPMIKEEQILKNNLEKISDKMTADVIESIIGAYYVDCGRYFNFYFL